MNRLLSLPTEFFRVRSIGDLCNYVLELLKILGKKFKP